MEMKRFSLLLIVLAIVGMVGAQSPKPYLVADFTENELGPMLDLCHRGGFEYLVHRNPFATYGHYEWNRDFARKGTESVARMIQRAEEEGVHLGLLVQADAISTDDSYFTPKYYSQLRREGQVVLFSALKEDDHNVALRRNEVLKNPSSLNLILIDDELISYGTMEFAGDLVLLHHCSRGMYGTKSAAHKATAEAYKLWDAPDRYVAPDGELLATVRRQLEDRLSAAGVPFVMYKGAAGQEMLDESIRVRQVERWEAEGVQNGSLGWFVIRATDKLKAGTTMEDLEWMLSKAACFDAGYGLLVDPKAMKSHGLLNEMLTKTRQWNELIVDGAFSPSQKERLRDPYLNWHLEPQEDGHYVLYPINISRRYQCNFISEESGLLTSEKWTWNAEEEGRYGLRIMVDGSTEIHDAMVNTEKGLVLFPCVIRPGQQLCYDFTDVARVMDANYNIVKEVTVEGLSELPEGDSEVYFICEYDPSKKRPEVSLRYVTHEKTEEIYPNK